MGFSRGFWVCVSFMALFSGCFSTPLEPEWSDGGQGEISTSEDVGQAVVDGVDATPCTGSDFCQVAGESQCAENPSQLKVCSDVGADCLEWQLEFCGADQVCVSGACADSNL